MHFLIVAAHWTSRMNDIALTLRNARVAAQMRKMFCYKTRELSRACAAQVYIQKTHTRILENVAA